jgi:hypothetical protein
VEGATVRDQRKRWWRLSVVLILSSLLGAYLLAPTVAGSSKNLEGKELRLAAGLESAVETLASLLGKDKLGGSVTAVRVLEDRDREIVVEVTYTGFGGNRLWAECLGANKKEQREIDTSEVTLPDDERPVRVILSLDEDATGEDFKSHFLRINVSHPSRPGVLYRTYELGKKWRLEPEAPLVVEVVAEPIGAAAKLSKTDPTIVPPAPKGTRIRESKPSQSVPQRTVRPATRDAKSRTSTARVQARGQTPPAAAQSRTVRSVQRSGVSAKAAATKPGTSGLSRDKLRAVAGSENLGLKPGQVDRGAKGPSNSGIDILPDWRADVELDRDEILNLWSTVYQDQNPDSGFFYFAPYGYYLQWNPDEGYALRVLYTAGESEESAGDVVMEMRLDSGVSNSDVQLANDLLRAYVARHGGIKFSELLRLPIEGAPEVSFTASQYDIPAEDVNVTSLSDSLAQVSISLSMDAVTKENLQLALVEDVGVNGSLVLDPDGDALPPQEIAVEVQIADSSTLGRFEWRRGATWRNPTPYPITLRYLHVLLLEKNEPIVYSWSLGDAEVASGSQVVFDAEQVPRWLDQKANRMWLDYRVDKDCKRCDQEVIAAITGGVAGIGAAEISIRTLRPLADTGGHEIAIEIRSRYFHPSERALQQKPPLILREDDQTRTLGPIYVDSRGAYDMDPLFEYTLQLVMPDGTTYRGDRWIPSDDLYLPLGTAQLREALGELP